MKSKGQTQLRESKGAFVSATDGDGRDIPDHDVACPMCGYNLRGLSLSRCPECGFECTWQDLLSPDRRVPYDLFEYAPRRKLIALLRTLGLCVARPVSLWRRLQPQHPWRPKRLLILYLVCALPLLVGLSIDWITIGVRIHNESLAARPGQTGIWNGTSPGISAQLLSERRAWLQREYGSLQAFLDYEAPLAPSMRFFERMIEECARATKYAVILVAWPLLTFGSLSLYRRSVQRYQVHRSHLARVAVYAHVPMFWLGMLFSLCIMLALWKAPEIVTRHTWRPPLFFQWFLIRADRTTEHAVLWLAVSSLCCSTALLIVACRHYLRIPRPIAGVVASQILILLALMAWKLSG